MGQSSYLLQKDTYYAIRGKVLGSGDFVQVVMRDAGVTTVRQVRNRGSKPIEEIIGRMCRESGVGGSVGDPPHGAERKAKETFLDAMLNALCLISFNGSVTPETVDRS
jgi:hypothetical protein